MNPPRKRQPTILTIAEVGMIADEVKPELKALVLLSAWCGLRWGEVTELRRHDIDKDCQVVYVGRAVTHRGGKCQIDTTKSAKPRAVVTPPHIREDVKTHLARYVLKDREAKLFVAPRACHFNERTFRDIFKEATKAVGREHVRIHDLRHFAGTVVARVANLPETMAFLGHSTVRASLLYQGLVSGRDAEIAALHAGAVGSHPRHRSGR